MATKSILKTIYLKDEKPARAFINALENAENKAEQTVTLSRGYSEASRTEIRKLFGVHDDRI